MSTQSAFLLALRGELEASKKALEKIVGNEAIKDPVVLAVAHNNLIAAKARFLDHDVVTGLVKKSSAVNPKDLLRVLERVTEGKGALSLHLPTQLDQRLSERQKCALHCNRALLLILTDKCVTVLPICCCFARVFLSSFVLLDPVARVFGCSCIWSFNVCACGRVLGFTLPVSFPTSTSPACQRQLPSPSASLLSTYSTPSSSPIILTHL